MANPFKRTDTFNDGPFLDVVDGSEGQPTEAGLPPLLRSNSTGLWDFQLFHDPDRDGQGYFKRVVRVPGKGDILFYKLWETWVQPVSPVLVARWVLRPAQEMGFTGRKEWVLWRLEGPGYIRNFAPPESLAGIRGGPNFQWIWDSYQKPPTAVETSRGKVWTDGGGIPYGVETADGWSPTLVPVSAAWYELNGNADGSDWSRTDITPMDLVLDVKKGKEYRQGSHPGIYQPITFNRQFFAALASLAFTDAQILSMSPATVVRLYYGMGKWIMDNNCPVYQSPYWAGIPGSDKWPVSLGVQAAVVEYKLRQRIYALRTDLHEIPLADGTKIPGIVDYASFPPRDGLECKQRGAVDATATWVGLVASFLPGIGTWLSLVQFSTQLADTLEAVSRGNKLAAWVNDLTTGARILGTIDRPPATVPGSGTGSGIVPGPGNQLPATGTKTGVGFIPLAVAAGIVLSLGRK